MKYLYVFALTMRKRKSRAVKCWFFGMTAIATMKTQQLWSPALGQYRKGRVISQTWAGEALTEPCLSDWTLAPGSWGGEVTVFSCVAQVSPADSTGQFQTIVRQMVVVKLSGSKMKPKDINTKVGFAWNWEQTEVGKRHEKKELRITRMLCAQVWSSQIQI